VQIEEPHDLKCGIVQEVEVQIENHRNLEEGGKKNHREFRNKDRWKLFQQYKKRYL
jgi:hypothetical protein